MGIYPLASYAAVSLYDSNDNARTVGSLPRHHGNWVSLLVAILCLAISVLIYIPFVRLAETINLESAKVGGHHD